MPVTNLLKKIVHVLYYGRKWSYNEKKKKNIKHTPVEGFFGTYHKSAVPFDLLSSMAAKRFPLKLRPIFSGKSLGLKSEWLLALLPLKKCCSTFRIFYFILFEREQHFFRGGIFYFLEVSSNLTTFLLWRYRRKYIIPDSGSSYVTPEKSSN